MRISINNLKLSQGEPKTTPNAGVREYVEEELLATNAALKACGIIPPSELSDVNLSVVQLVNVAGGLFVPEELNANLVSDPSIDKTTRSYVKRDLHPSLLALLKTSDERALKVGHQLGRLRASHSQDSTDKSKGSPTVSIDGETVSCAGQTAEALFEKGIVIDLGMGMRGLWHHLKNVKAGKYAVTGVHHTKLENVFLGGILDYHGVTNGVTLKSHGITSALKGMRSEGSQADLVIASRVHGAGTELTRAVAYMPSVLAEAGLFVAQGPQNNPDGGGYNAVAQAVTRHSKLRVMLDHGFIFRHPYKGQESNRLTVAAKI